MRRFQRIWAYCTALLLPFLIGSAAPALAAWEGTHRYSVVIQGSLSAVDRLQNVSQSQPVEFRAMVTVVVDPPTATGEYFGRLRVSEASVHQGDGMVEITGPAAGYRIRLHPSEGPSLLDPADVFAAYGIDLAQILMMLFPVPPTQGLHEGASWTMTYSQAVLAEETQLTVPVTHTFTVSELRDDLIVVQSSLYGSASALLTPGSVRTDQVGSGRLHIDPVTGNLIRSAVTVRATVERIVPAGALAPEARTVLTGLVTTSVERLADTADVAPPSLGPLYVDPAERFSLRLPEGWRAEPIELSHTVTIFAHDDQKQVIYVDLAPASSRQDPNEVARTMLDMYARYLVNFRVLTEPTPSRLGPYTAVFAEYAYSDETDVYEAALYTQVNGYNVALQYAADYEAYRGAGPELLEAMAGQFVFGPHPEGHVAADRLVIAPSIVYESRRYAFEIGVPLLWPPVDTDDGSIRFVEIGGAGALNIHLESVSPEESAQTLLEQWVRRVSASQPGVEVLSPAQPAALGPLSGAAAVLRWTFDDAQTTQKIVVANWQGTLYVVSVEYVSSGFDERAAVFERIFSGFVPRPEWVLAQLYTFDAYAPPPLPSPASPNLVIGRILHEYREAGQTVRRPAQQVRIDVLAAGETFTAVTDDDGFFYLANLPVQAGAELAIRAVRGRLFNLPYDVSIPIEGLTLSVDGQVSLVGELTFILLPDGETVSLRPESGFDPETGTSRVHQAFLNRFPDSPWAEIVRADLAARLGM